MNEGENFLTIGALSSLIDQKVKRIQKGNLKIQMLEQLLDEVKELQERLIIIKYKAMEKMAKPPVEKNLFSAENFEPYQSEEPRPALNFELTKKLEVQVIPENQISLIDSIEELSKEEKKTARKSGRKEKSKKKKRKKDKLEKEHREITQGAEEKAKLDQSRGEIETKLPFVQIATVTTSEIATTGKEDEIKFSDKIFDEVPVPEKAQEEEIIKEAPKSVEGPETKKTKIPIQKSNKTTLSQKIRKTHIESISKAIKLNQRIGMIKKLFGGDDQLFKSEINNLDESNNLQDAQNHLERLKNNGNWNEEDQWYILLTQLVERRHS